MRLLNLLLVPTVLIAALPAFAAEPSGDSAAAAPPVVVLRGSSAPPTPWYSPPPSPQPPSSDVDVGDVPYVLPYYYLPYSSFALRHRFVPRDRPAAAPFPRGRPAAAQFHPR
jgi:hypothetical protein